MIMTRQDTEKLFELLMALSVTWKPKKNAALAWTLVLEPYDYETVKAATIRLQRKTAQIPLPAEIVREIEAQEAASAPETEETDEPTPQEAEALKLYKIICATRKAKGLPEHLSEAHEYGMTAAELADKYDEAGCSCDAAMKAMMRR